MGDITVTTASLARLCSWDAAAQCGIANHTLSRTIKEWYDATPADFKKIVPGTRA